MARFLVCILCSSKLELFKLSLESALNQQNYDDYEICVVVNTLNDTFWGQVVDFLQKNRHEKIKSVIRTDSNGRPGKGHNSVLKIFKERTEYENLIPLDGDDFLYPCALEHMDRVLDRTSFDVLGLAGNTKLKKTETHQAVKDGFNISFSIGFTEYKNVRRFSPDYNRILATPFRLLALNRKVFGVLGDQLYDEEMVLYDDYLYFLRIYEFMRRSGFEQVEELQVTLLSDPHIYLYNTLNDASLSQRTSYKQDLQRVESLKTSLEISELKCEEMRITPYEELCDRGIDLAMVERFYKRMTKRLLASCDIVLKS